MDGGDFIERPADTFRHPAAIRMMMEIVCAHMNVPVSLVRSTWRDPGLMDIRSAIAVLSGEFYPRVSAQAVEDAMLRGAGMVSYYRLRHVDRLRLYSKYSRTYGRCRYTMLEYMKSGTQASPPSPGATPLPPTAAAPVARVLAQSERSFDAERR